MTNKVMEIEAKIERLQEQRKANIYVDEDEGTGVYYTPEYFNIEAKLERLYDELDELAEVGE